jgi:multidrug efflux pump subunit AcrA (membrane-fusion protein)
LFSVLRPHDREPHCPQAHALLVMNRHQQPAVAGELAAAATAHQLAQNQLNAAQSALIVAHLKRKALALEEETRLARVALVGAEEEAAEQAAAAARTSLEEKAASVDRSVAATVEAEPKVWQAIKKADDSDAYLDVSAKVFPWWVHHEPEKGNFCKVCIAGNARTKNGVWVTKGSNNNDAR